MARFMKPDGDYYTNPSKFLTFNDVLLVPQKSRFSSRNDPSISLKTRISDSIELATPIISANMDTITGSEMAIAMGKLGGMGILHRFYPTEQDYIDEIKKVASELEVVAFSVGCDTKWLKFIENAIDACPNKNNFLVCLDVAHGHMEQCIKMVKNIRGIKMKYDEKGINLTIMAGNVVTADAIHDLYEWGAESIKCGIGGSGICSTRMVTGHGMPQLSAIMECVKGNKNFGCSIIADGGIRHSGDIVKAFAAGANAVMLGGMLSGTKETPGDINEFSDGSRKKLYRGQSSRHFLNDIKKKGVAAEGISVEVNYKGDVESVLSEIIGGIRSGFTYSGVATIEELQKQAIFIEMTSNGWEESTPHKLSNI